MKEAAEIKKSNNLEIANYVAELKRMYNQVLICFISEISPLIICAQLYCNIAR